MNNLPPNWQAKSLGEVVEIVTPSVTPFIGEKYYADTGSILDNVVIDQISIEYQTKPSRANVTVQPNDVLFARMQSTIKVLLINESMKDIIFSTGFANLRSTKDIYPRYLRQFLISSSFNKLKDKLCTGATQKAISNDKIKNIPIPLPSLSIQKQIADILEKVDEAKQKRKEASKLTDEFLKSVFIEMFGDPSDYESRYELVEISDITTAIDSGWSPKCEEYSRTLENQWAVLKLSAVTYGEYRPFENKVLPNNFRPKQNIEVTKGNLLLARKNTSELVGSTAYVFKTPPKLLMSDTIFRFVYMKEKVKGEFLWCLLSSPLFRKKLSGLATGSAGSMPNISKAKLLKFLIPLPPFPVQQEFAEIVNKTEALKEKQKQSELELENLFQSLMQRAFKGELEFS